MASLVAVMSLGAGAAHADGGLGTDGYPPPSPDVAEAVASWYAEGAVAEADYHGRVALGAAPVCASTLTVDPTKYYVVVGDPEDSGTVHGGYAAAACAAYDGLLTFRLRLLRYDPATKKIDHQVDRCENSFGDRVGTALVSGACEIHYTYDAGDDDQYKTHAMQACILPINACRTSSPWLKLPPAA